MLDLRSRHMVRYALLAGCASAIGLAAGLAEGPARAQAFQGTPIAVATGTVTFDRTTPGVETITALRPTAIIDWTPSDTTGTGTVNFLPQGNVATFTSTAAVGAGYTILNRIMPSDTTRSVTLDGIVHGYQGGTTTNGGTLWFYSPGGLIVGADARLDVGSLLLTANPIAIGTNNELYGSSGQIQLRAGNAAAQVAIANGATIMAPQPGSYIAVVSPRITQGGVVNVNGSAAYVAADSADLTFNAGLFTIAVQTGATASADILQHTGTTTGPASTGASDPHRIYLVAVSRNDAITMLVSGTLGFTAATSASVQNGAIILSLGRDISGGDPPANPGSIGANGTLRLTNATVTSPVDLFSKGYAEVSASGQVPVGRIDTTQGIILDTPGVTGGGTLTAAGDIAVNGGSFALGNVTAGTTITANVTGDLSAGVVTATNGIGITAGGLVTLASATVGDDLTINAGSANLTMLRATYTGGSDAGNDGSNIRVTTTGALAVHDAAAVYGIALTAGTGGTGTLTADLLHTDRAATTVVNQGSGDIRLTTLDSQGDITLTATGGAITGSSVVSHAGNIATTGASSFAVDTLNANTIALTASGPVTSTSLTAVNGATVTTPGLVTLTTATVGDDLTINAGTATLGSLSATYTGGSDAGNDGSNIRVTTTGALSIQSASAVYGIALTAGTGGVATLTAGALHTDRAATTIINKSSGALALTSVDSSGDVTLTGTGGTIGGATIASRSGGITVSGGAALTVGTYSAGQNIALTATGDITSTSLTAVNAASVTTPGLVTLASATVGDDLTINVGSANLTMLRATYTGGSDAGNDGSNIRVTTTGALAVHDAAAVYGIALTAGTGGTGTLTADLLHTDRAATTVVNQGSGDIRLTTLDSQGDVTLTATGGAITGSSVVSHAGNIATTGASSFAVDTLNANTIALTASGPVTSTSLTAVNGATVTTPGLVTLTTATVGDDLTINAGTATLGSLSATYTGGSDAGNDGSNIRVTTTGALSIQSASAVYGIALTAGTGGVATLTAGALHTDRAATTIINKSSGALALTSVDSSGDVTLTGTGGTIGGATIASRSGGITVSGGAALTVGTYSAGQNIALTATGDITSTSLTAVNAASVTTPGLVTLASATVGDDLTINAGSANLTMLRATYTGGSDAGNDGSNIRVTTTGALAVHDAAAVYGIALTAATGGTGTLTADLLHTDRAATAVVNQGSGDIRLTTLDSQGDITLTATGGAITGSSVVSHAGNIATTGASSFAVDTLNANTIALTASGPVTSTSLTAVNGATVTTPGLVTLTTATVGDDLTINAGTATLGSLSATYTGGSDAGNDGSNIRVTTTGALSIQSASAVYGIALTAGTGGGGTITAPSLTSGRGAGISVSGDTVQIGSPGDLLLNSLSASGAATVTSGGVLELRGRTSAGTLALTANDLAIDPGSSVVGAEVGIVSTNGDGATIGDNAGGLGLTLSNAEFGRIHAAALTISTTGGPAPTFRVGDLTATGSGAGLASDGTPNGTISGTTGSLSLITPGALTVTGAVRLGNALASDTLSLSAGTTLTVQVPGSLAILDANGVPIGTLRLSGNTIVDASASAIGDLAATTSFAQRDARLADQRRHRRSDRHARRRNDRVRRQSGGVRPEQRRNGSGGSRRADHRPGRHHRHRHGYPVPRGHHQRSCSSVRRHVRCRACACGADRLFRADSVSQPGDGQRLHRRHELHGDVRNADANANPDIYSNSNSHTHTHTHIHTDAHTDAYAHSDTHAYAYAYAYAYAHSDSDTDTDTHADAYAHSDTHAYANIDADTDTDVRARRQRDCRAGADDHPGRHPARRARSCRAAHRRRGRAAGADDRGARAFRRRLERLGRHRRTGDRLRERSRGCFGRRRPDHGPAVTAAGLRPWSDEGNRQGLQRGERAMIAGVDGLFVPVERQQIDRAEVRLDEQVGEAPVRLAPGLARDQAGPHQQFEDVGHLVPAGTEHPGERARFNLRLVGAEHRPCRDIDADHPAAREGRHEVDGEVVHQSAVHQHVVTVDQRRHDPRQRRRGPERAAQEPLAVDLRLGRRKIGRDTEERAPAVDDVGIAEMFGEQRRHAAAARKRDERKRVVRDRLIEHETVVDLALNLFQIDVVRRSAPDDRAHAGAADQVRGDPRLPERPQRADVCETSRAAAGQHQADRPPRDEARDPAVIGRIAACDVEDLIGREMAEPQPAARRIRVAGGVNQHDVLGLRATRERGHFRDSQRIGLRPSGRDEQHPVRLPDRAGGPGRATIAGDVDAQSAGGGRRACVRIALVDDDHVATECPERPRDLAGCGIVDRIVADRDDGHRLDAHWTVFADRHRLQPGGELPEKERHERWARRQKPVRQGGGDAQNLAVTQGHDGGGAGLVRDQRHLADELAGYAVMHQAAPKPLVDEHAQPPIEKHEHVALLLALFEQGGSARNPVPEDAILQRRDLRRSEGCQHLTQDGHLCQAPRLLVRCRDRVRVDLHRHLLIVRRKD